MSGPWEKFAKKEAIESGPWDNYSKNDNEPGLVSKSLGAVSKVLDYPSGLARVSAAGLANIPYSLSTGKSLTKEDDLLSALKGDAPTSAQYLERAGLEAGPSVDVPIVGPVSLRDVEGFGLDVALDPLSVLGKAGKIAKPVKGLLEKSGKSAYKSGLKKVDERLIETGAKPIADTLMQKGKWGKTETLLKETQKIGSESLAERQFLYDKANDLGVKIDLSSATKSADAELAKIRKDPNMRGVADNLDEFISNYKNNPNLDMATVSEWKSNLYNALPESAFQGGKIKGPVQKFQKALANDFKNVIVKSGNAAEPGLGDKIDKLNETMQSTITAKKPMKMQIRREITPNSLTVVDAMIGGYGLTDPVTAMKILATKKLGEATKKTSVRTGGGLLLNKIAKTPYLDDASRRGLINILRSEEQ